jgi:protoheme IX farnesyltransferase
MAVVVSAPHTPVQLPIAQPRSTSSLRWLALATALASGLALVGEGLGRSAPPWTPLAIATQTLSFGAAGLTMLLAIGVWISRRDALGLLIAASVAAVGVAVRITAAAVLDALDVPTLRQFIAGGLAYAVLGLLVWLATATAPAPVRYGRGSPSAAALFRRVVDVTLVVVYVAALGGVAVQAAGASWACQGFPDCNGLGLLPFGRGPLLDIHLYHRLMAYVASGLVVWVAIEARRTQRYVPAIGRAALVLGLATLAEAAIGALAVSMDVSPLSQGLHAVGAVGTWSAMVVVAALAHRTPAPALTAVKSRPTAHRRTLSVYIQLTKPRVMSLLLATTVAAMVIAAHGLPKWGVLVATVLGGALMSGGAGAINHYVDRDIDPLMGRTAWRPIPSGAVAPRRALWFGVVLSVLATLLFVAFVNQLAAALALVGLLGYVFVYSLWLKRSTPSNIVIGGAAGAIPPLVGWAAVTGDLSNLTAWYLFAIIFFWTPPHFWALSLLIRKHYERAGVPMLPVVRGEAETRRQILLYSLLLVALTLVLPPFRLMGLPYFAAAAVLGGVFVANAVRLWRRPTPQAARGLYTYSILYLFALFAAMAVDRVLA